MQPAPFPLPPHLRHELVRRAVHPLPRVRRPHQPQHRGHEPTTKGRTRHLEHLPGEVPQVRRVHVPRPPLRRSLDDRQHEPTLHHLHRHVQRAEVQRLARSLAHRRQRRADGVQDPLPQPRLRGARAGEHAEVDLVAGARVHLPVVLRVAHRGAHPRDDASRRGRVRAHPSEGFGLRRLPPSRALQRPRRVLQRRSRVRSLVVAVGDSLDDQIEALRAGFL
mmetsp:Transcript_8448/g.38448  ORF Transcript_8448/g.38448 Transcript_8448/m.38448 type:complete len:221 (+) Transcript_8448:219-881(+)